MIRDHCPVCLSVCLSVYLSVCLSLCLSVTLVYRVQTVGWIKMPLGTEVGLSPGNIALDADPAPPLKGAQQSPLSAHVYYGETVAHLSYC